MELWSLMHFLMPHVFQSHKDFKEWFSNPLSGMIEGSREYNEGLIKRLHKVGLPKLSFAGLSLGTLKPWVATWHKCKYFWCTWTVIDKLKHRCLETKDSCKMWMQMLPVLFDWLRTVGKQCARLHFSNEKSFICTTREYCTQKHQCFQCIVNSCLCLYSTTQK